MTLEEVKVILAGMEQVAVLDSMDETVLCEQRNEALRIAIRFIELEQKNVYCHDCALAVESSDNEFQCISGAYDVDGKSCFVLKME